MTRVKVIEVKFAGYKLKLDGITAGQVPQKKLALERAAALAASNGETSYELELVDGSIEVINI